MLSDNLDVIQGNRNLDCNSHESDLSVNQPVSATDSSPEGLGCETYSSQPELVTS